MFDQLRHFFEKHSEWITILGIGSILAGVGSLLLIPWLIVRLPPDYFNGPQRSMTDWKIEHPGLRWSVLILKNLLGIVFLLSGIVMLALPGQGLLMMLAGIILMNFPGKRRWERWCISRPRILRAVNWIRRRKNHPPITID
ncbi:MAG: PGPGW domain-containing protein [Planctomycetaceae bacterium]